MAYNNTFKKDETGQFSRVFPPTLNQGQSFTDPAGRTGIVQFNTETGERLLPGQTTPTQPTRTLPSTTPQPSPYAYGRLPDDQLNEFNTATGQRNPNFSPPQAPSATAPTTTDPYTAFNMLLQESLKSAQKIDTSSLLKRQKELQLERLKRSRGEGIVSLTPEQLKFASPESQASMRNAWVGALNPEITENQFQQTRLENERKNLLEQIRFAQEQGNKVQEIELKAQAFDLDERKLEETIRSNKATEGINRQKADDSSNVPTMKTINGVDMQWDSATNKWIPAVVDENVDSNKVQNSLANLKWLKETATKAKDLAGASGPSGIGKYLGDTLIGDTKFRQLESYLNTLQTNVLTLSTDPSIKKFFGPQMSNADVQLMISAGTTLNAEKQNPSQIRTEIGRLEDLFTRMESSLNQGLGTSGSGDAEYNAYLKAIK